MRKLPKWVILSKFPALYDLESATVIEMTAKIYGAMGDMIDEYNKFAESVNASIKAFENGMTTDYEEFTVGLRQEFQDFIDVVETKIQEQNVYINDTMTYVKNNMYTIASNAINDAIQAGTIHVSDYYDEETESYNIIITGGV